MYLLSIFIFHPHTELNHPWTKPELFLPLSDGRKGSPKVIGWAQESIRVVNDVGVGATWSYNLLVSTGPAVLGSGLLLGSLFSSKCHLKLVDFHVTWYTGKSSISRCGRCKDSRTRHCASFLLVGATVYLLQCKGCSVVSFTQLLRLYSNIK